MLLVNPYGMVMPFLTVVKQLHSNAYLVHNLLAVLLRHCCGATEHLVSPISNADSRLNNPQEAL